MSINEHANEIELAAPHKFFPSLNLRELWAYRELIFFMLARDLKGRYRQMALGPLWIVIHPLLNMGLFTVIFGMVAKLPSDGVPYPLFNYAALLPWTYFSGAAATAANSLLANRHLISKVYFPRLAVVIVGVLGGLVDFAVSFVLLLGMMLAYGYAIPWTVVFVPVLLVAAALVAMAIGLWAASWIVHFHDAADILGYFIKGLMYASPVVYASSLIPAKWHTLYYLNPMSHVVEGFRWALLGTAPPPWGLGAISLALVLPVAVLGAYHFRRTERSIVDIA